MTVADLYLVRHGQASFGAADYDKLSTLGEEQSRLLGRWLKRCGIVPDAVASGTMKRQLGTAVLALAESGGPARGDWLSLDGLGEYDHETVVARFRPDYADKAVMKADLARSPDPRRTFHAMYVQAVARWTGGAHDADYPEPWSAFRQRVLGGLRRLAALEARSVWAFTSGGPITAICQHLLGLPDETAFALNWPLVNAGVTRLRFSRAEGAVTLATFNGHPHLDETGDAGLVTFR